MITTRRAFLLAILLAASTLACSNTYTVPLALTNLNETTELVASKPTGPPTAHITSHADGLGWTVRAEQTVEQTLHVTHEETWKGKRYTRLKLPWYAYPIMATFDLGILCPLGLVHALTLAFTVTEPTYRTTMEGCVLAPSGFEIRKSEDDIVLKQTPSSEFRTTLNRQPFSSGTVSLLWISPGQDAVGIEERLDAETGPVVFRLRWLADIFARNNRAFDPRGHLVIRLARPHEPPTDFPLSIPIESLRSAQARQVARATSEHWPQSIRIRLVTQEPSPASHRGETLEAHLLRYLRERHIPVVLRGAQGRQTEVVQRRQLQPAYQDTQRIGQWIGGTLLVLASHATPAPGASIVTLTVANIETREVLGQCDAEGRTTDWSALMDTLDGKLAELLAEKAGATRREGILLQE